MSERVTKGWAVPRTALEAHYFVFGKSLCGPWLHFLEDGALEDALHDHPDNCFECMRLRQEIEATNAREVQ